MAACHPKGAYILLTQFNTIIDMLLALVFYARGDAPAMEAHEQGMMARGRYNRNIEVAFNTLLGRADAGRTAALPAPASASASGAGALASPVRRLLAGPRVMDKRVPVPPGRFQRLEVDADTSIREFVNTTGAVFVPGRGFYELTKPEDVSDKKEVIVEHISSGDMFSGTDAKEMLGLPAIGAGKVSTKSVPAGHRAFIQSTSYNRVLKAGSDFLYELS